MQETLNVAAVLDSLSELWSPRVVAAVNDYDVKVASIAGEFTEHVHDDTDEFFLVLAGRLRLALPDRTIELGPSDVFTVPRGVKHRPSADEGTRILMFEPRGTINTGDPETGTAGVRLVD